MRLAADASTCNPASVATRNCIVRLGSTFVWAQGDFIWLSVFVTTNNRCGYGAISLRRLTKAIRSAVYEWTKSERSFRSTTHTSSRTGYRVVSQR